MIHIRKFFDEGVHDIYYAINNVIDINTVTEQLIAHINYEKVVTAHMENVKRPKIIIIQSERFSKIDITLQYLKMFPD